MKLARIRTADGVRTGTIDGEIAHTDTGSYKLGEDASLLAPCDPSAIYCVGRNFASTLEKMDYERPETPDWFIKPPVSSHPPNTPIKYPSWTSELTCAGELAAVMTSTTAPLEIDEVDTAVRGYTILNDLDALDQDGRTARKAFDCSAPIGPWIETDLEVDDIDMTTHVNGELRQEANTSEMIFSPREVISFLSDRYRFRSGDVISFGSPAYPGVLTPGDKIEIWFEGIGTLCNTIQR